MAIPKKVLQSTTIIPERLYIDRAADRQLNSIIEDMGRPGYVLVARQMGKTNLLINMKRRREGLGDIVGYFDLSNRLSSDRRLFRSIIDLYLEAYSGTFFEVSKEITAQRIQTDVPANVEYDRHLRLLLRAAPENRLIIILDEIDSLVNATYSDSFLAQVRSMYFSRTNHPEFQRLTYVLSGVAEPTDLIKDKNISPFNIGEKIYLDDFSRTEFDRFIVASGLSVSEEVKASIYGWTCGNPRMTYDLCSAIEDLVREGRHPSVSDVRNSVNNLYLSRFDRAPVDHVRILAETDPLIRDAIVSIRYGKGDSLSERVKSKLYLAGVIRAAGTEVKIKNPIIDAALSDLWLGQITAGKRSLIEAASDSFAAKRYDQAVRLFNQAEQEEFGESLHAAHLLERGLAKFYLGDYAAAVPDLLTASKNGGVNSVELDYYIGTALIGDRKFTDGIPYLERAEGALAFPLVLSAKITLSSAYLASDAEELARQALTLAEDVIDASAPGADGALEAQADLLSAALYNAAWASHELRDDAAARSFIERALTESPPQHHPAILLFGFNLTNQTQKKKEIAEQVAEVIIGQRLDLQGENAFPLQFSEHILCMALCRLLVVNSTAKFERLYGYARQTLFSDRLSNAELALRLFKADRYTGDRENFAPLLGHAADNWLDSDVTLPLKIEILRLFSAYAPTGEKARALARFVREFLASANDEQLTDTNLLAVFSYVAVQVQLKNYPAARSALDALSPFETTIEQQEPLIHILFLQQSLTLAQTLRDQDGALRAAQAILRVTEDDRKYSDAELSGVIGQLRTSARDTVRKFSADPFRKLGRNSRVVVRLPDTEEVFTRKFKLVEAELRAGRLELVRTVSGDN
ncbi:hypothetical protein BH11PSE2_BH11PSE2_07560 [soil metagenome]